MKMCKKDSNLKGIFFCKYPHGDQLHLITENELSQLVFENDQYVYKTPTETSPAAGLVLTRIGIPRSASSNFNDVGFLSVKIRDKNMIVECYK